MEHDNVKWKYNLEKHSVYEFDLPNATHLIIPVSGTVDWADGEDVTGKFTIKTEHPGLYEKDYAIPIKQEQPQERMVGGSWLNNPQSQEQPHNFFCQSEADGRVRCITVCTDPICNRKQEQPPEDKMDAKREAKAKELIKNLTPKKVAKLEAILQSQEQPPLLESIANTLKLGKELVKQLENQSQEQDNVIGGGKTAYDFLTERFGHFNSFHPVSVLGYAKGIEPDIEDILECMEDYLDLRLPPLLQQIKDLQDREQWLIHANEFHKLEAHKAIQEQYRLQKEVEACKEILKYMSVIEEMKDSDYKNFCEARNKMYELKIY